MLRSQIQLIRSRLPLGVLAVLGAIAPMALQAEDNRAPVVPMEIAVPAGHKVHFQGYAQGVQIYTWDGSSWGASVPEATLFDQDGNVVGSHYQGPTWESNSGSKVVGTVVPPRVTVDPDSIPWLRLSAAHTEGPGIFAATTFVQRVNTVGGKAPALPGNFVGQVVRVPYASDYFFFREATN